jgi:hypothetical protein
MMRSPPTRTNILLVRVGGLRIMSNDYPTGTLCEQSLMVPGINSQFNKLYPATV